MNLDIQTLQLSVDRCSLIQYVVCPSPWVVEISFLRKSLSHLHDDLGDLPSNCWLCKEGCECHQTYPVWLWTSPSQPQLSGWPHMCNDISLCRQWRRRVACSIPSQGLLRLTCRIPLPGLNARLVWSNVPDVTAALLTHFTSEDKLLMSGSCPSSSLCTVEHSGVSFERNAHVQHCSHCNIEGASPLVGPEYAGRVQEERKTCKFHWACTGETDQLCCQLISDGYESALSLMHV